MRVVLYLRVSTEGQLDGYGLDTQEEACRAYAATHGWEVVHVAREEAKSGTLPAHERPGLTEALSWFGEECCAEVFLAARLDRIARELLVQEAILAQAWGATATVHTVAEGEIRRDDPDDPMRTAMRQMVGVFAQLDRALVIKRLRDGRRTKAAKGGKASGQYRYGYGKLGPVPEEQKALVHLLDCQERELTLAATAASLNSRGFATRQGREWTVGTVGNVLRRTRSATPVG